MKPLYKGYNFRLLPTPLQKELLGKHFGCCRFVYNYFLAERIEQYNTLGKSDNYFGQCAKLKELKDTEGFKWLKEVNAEALTASLRCLDAAFRNFFDGQCEFPQFKRRKNKKSFTIPQDSRLEGDKFRLCKFKGGIKVIAHTPVLGKIKKCTVTMTASGDYYVAIVSEEEYQPMIKTGKSIGIDLGICTLVTTSDGTTYDNHKYTHQYEKELAKAQRHLSRKVKGSASYERQRIKVAQIHQKITNSRMDNLHKISHQLVSQYDLIVMEDLAVKEMITNPRFSKCISDVSWGTLSRFITYKADWYDKQLIKVDRYYPSSKKCNVCGCINHDLTLDMRKWTCITGHELDRDINAAQNILEEGIRIINTSSGTGDYTDGDLSKTSIRKRKSVKSGTTHSLL